MQVEVSAETRARIESLVESGEYPTAQAVVDAALDALVFDDHVLPDAEVSRVELKARRAREAGTVRVVDEALLSDLRQRIDSPLPS